MAKLINYRRRAHFRGRRVKQFSTATIHQLAHLLVTLGAFYFSLAQASGSHERYDKIQSNDLFDYVFDYVSNAGANTRKNTRNGDPLIEQGTSNDFSSDAAGAAVVEPSTTKASHLRTPQLFPASQPAPLATPLPTQPVVVNAGHPETNGIQRDHSRQKEESCSSPTCQDNPSWRSKLGLTCSMHAVFIQPEKDCQVWKNGYFHWMHTGYTDKDVLSLIEQCPCTCQHECTAPPESRSNIDTLAINTTTETRTLPQILTPDPTKPLALQPLPSSSINVNDCTLGSCKNGGICIDEHNSFRCVCRIGYTGPHCDIGPDAGPASADELAMRPPAGKPHSRSPTLHPTSHPTSYPASHQTLFPTQDLRATPEVAATAPPTPQPEFPDHCSERGNGDRYCFYYRQDRHCEMIIDIGNLGNPQLCSCCNFDALGPSSKIVHYDCSNIGQGWGTTGECKVSLEEISPRVDLGSIPSNLIMAENGTPDLVREESGVGKLPSILGVTLLFVVVGLAIIGTLMWRRHMGADEGADSASGANLGLAQNQFVEAKCQENGTTLLSWEGEDGSVDEEGTRTVESPRQAELPPLPPFASKALSLAASTDTRRSSRTRKSNNRARFWSRKEGENAARDGSSRVNEKNVDWGELFVEDLTLLH